MPADEPDWYCTEEISEGAGRWKIDDDLGPLWGSWAYFGEERVHLMGFVTERDEQRIALFREQGFYADDLDTSVFVSPMRPVPPEGAWLTLRGNGAEIGPEYYGNHKLGPSSITISGAQLGVLLDGEQPLSLIVQDQSGDILHVVEIPRAAVHATAERLRDVFATVEYRRLDKPARCFDHRNDIVLVH